MNFKNWKILFFSSLITSILISISSNSWLGMWLGLEINVLSMIPLMNNTKNIFSTEASLKYFITQVIASTIILMSIILMSNNIFSNNYLILMLNSALLTKLGSAPFHFWFPEVMEGQPWNLCLILLTIQKITPLSILNYNTNLPLFFSTIIIINMIVSTIMGLNQISLRKILTYSSINHIGWMISSSFLMKLTWFYYFSIYTLINFNLIIMFKILNVYFFQQLIKSFNFPNLAKFTFMMNFLSLGGLPPFIGFLPKWLTIQNLIENNFTLLVTMMVVITLIALFYYLRLTFSTMMISSNEKFKHNSHHNKKTIMI
nr:NADH dehydrogenase subunit 2 [Deleaster bactrianus]